MQVDKCQQVLDATNGKARPNGRTDGPLAAQDNTGPLSYEEWLDDYLECEKGTLGRTYNRALQERDKQLWYGSTPVEGGFDSFFTTDDLLLLRAGGQVTSYEDWHRIVDVMYQHAWGESLASWACNQPVFLAEKDTLQDELIERVLNQHDDAPGQ